MSNKISGFLELTNLPASPATPAASVGRVYSKTDGDIYFKNDAGVESSLTLTASELLASTNVVFTQPAIVIHNGPGNTFTNVVTTSISIPSDGDWMLDLSFNYNGDSVNGDVVARSTFNAATLDLNDRAADPDGNNQILRIEPGESAPGPAGSITGTGSGQKMVFSKKFAPQALTIGSYSFVLDIGQESGATNASMWNVVAHWMRVA